MKETVFKPLAEIEMILAPYQRVAILSCGTCAMLSGTGRIYLQSIARSDAMVVLACAAGITSTFLCHPPIPVVTVLDPVGSAPISRDEDFVAQSMCTGCGHCVLNWTGGICPLSHCPARTKYGPCAKAPSDGGPCAVDAGRECIWSIIARRGHMGVPANIKELHKQQDLERPTPSFSSRGPDRIRRFLGWAGARFQAFEKIVHMID